MSGSTEIVYRFSIPEGLIKWGERLGIAVDSALVQKAVRQYLHNTEMARSYRKRVFADPAKKAAFYAKRRKYAAEYRQREGIPERRREWKRQNRKRLREIAEAAERARLDKVAAI